MAPRSEDFLSVVMPVHNALPHLDEAVRSILDQTHRNFEFVIYDDASTDGSREQLREWAKRDGRVRLIEGDRNLGPVGSSALVVDRSKAAIIARMDADDLCDPERLQVELSVLRADPSAGLVGTLFDIIDDHGRQIRSPDYWRVTRKSAFIPFAHGSIMYRRELYERIGGYRVECEFWEDQDLVLRMASVADVLVVPRPLYRFRQWLRPRRSEAETQRIENAVDLMYRCMARLDRGETYEDLLAESQDRQTSRVDPRVFVSAGSRTLWPGGRPMLLGRLVKRGKLGFDIRTASTLAWTAWAAASPRSLRALLRMLLRSRNARARKALSSAEPLHWSPLIGRSPCHSTRHAPPDLVRPADSR